MSEQGAVAVCSICPHHCRLREGEVGRCRARAAAGGHVHAVNYGRVTSLALDPIEKKPLYHFHPGSCILSVGSYGCNLACPFCQNHEISQAGARETSSVMLPPARLLALAQESHARGSIGVAFTYNEPLVGYEYVLDAARLLQAAGLAVVLVTNGQIEVAPLLRLLPFVDAMNIDLKGFTQSYYAWLGGDLETTKRTIACAVAAGVHVEVTTLVVPGKNDAAEEMAAEAAFLAALSTDLPLHLTRYFPRYRLGLPPTSRATLERLREVARQSLRFVHLGNV